MFHCCYSSSGEFNNDLQIKFRRRQIISNIHVLNQSTKMHSSGKVLVLLTDFEPVTNTKMLKTVKQ